jgi:hypothetical protein
MQLPREGGVSMSKSLTILLVFLSLLCLCAQAEERLSVNTANGALIMDTNGYIFPASRSYAQILPLVEDAFYAGMPKGEDNSRYALLDADGNALTAAVYDSLTAQNGSILFMREHFYGILRTDGTELLGPSAQQIVAANDGYLALGSNPYDDAPDEIIHILPDGTLLDTPTYVTAGLNPIIENRMRFTDEKGREGFTMPTVILPSPPNMTLRRILKTDSPPCGKTDCAASSTLTARNVCPLNGTLFSVWTTPLPH